MTQLPNERLYVCEGKQAFSSWTEANKALTRIRKFDDKASPLQIYRCPYCPAHHLGSKKRTRRS